MKKVKYTIKNDASYSSDNGLKLFSQCAEIQLTLRAFYDDTFISHFVKSTLHLHKAQNVRACHNYYDKLSAKYCWENILLLSELNTNYLRKFILKSQNKHISIFFSGTDTNTIRQKQNIYIFFFFKISLSMTISSTKGLDCVEHLNNIFQNVNLICVMVKATDVIQNF